MKARDFYDKRIKEEPTIGSIQLMDEYALIKNKYLTEKCYNLSIIKLELEVLIKQGTEEINHLKHEYKYVGHCVKYLRNVEILLENIKNI